ncbi:MAG: hypothetical protein ACJAXR_001927 [Halopseudomonas sp.]
MELLLGVAKCLARSLFDQSTVLTDHANAGAGAASEQEKDGQQGQRVEASQGNKQAIAQRGNRQGRPDQGEGIMPLEGETELIVMYNDRRRPSSKCTTRTKNLDTEVRGLDIATSAAVLLRNLNESEEDSYRFDSKGLLCSFLS